MSLDEGIYSLENGITDNYNEIIPIYNYGTKAEAQRLYPKMDRTIKKASIAIQKHSMYFGGQERVKWVQRSYLMMGKAHFLKQDYVSARRVFDYVAKQYGDSPISYEGYLWLAKTHMQTERYEKAEATLNFLQSRLDDSNFPKNVKRDMRMVQADFYIATGDYDAAYVNIERGIELGNNKDIITRAYFVLAQINQMEGDLNMATAFYDKVIKRNPNYIMDFEARINMAQCYDEGTGDSKNINKVLMKMVRDFKNNEFLDQIYYVLAEVALKDNNVENAINYLKLSVSKSVSDNYQKSRSALDLAEIYFDRNQYLLAEAYYDTAVSSLPEDFPDYNTIMNKASVLTEMVTNEQTIYTQDSLQRLAKLDSAELYAVIDEIIVNYKIEKKKKEKEMEQSLNDGGTAFLNPSVGGGNNQSLGGKWYFYNPQAISMGRSAFKQKWGNRKLEDNWRLLDKRNILKNGNKSDLAQEEITGGVAVSDSSVVAEIRPTNPETRTYYLVDIPSTPERMEASTEMIINAYQKLGFIYLEKLHDTATALETYLTFQKRYPDNIHRLESWYALYKIYNDKKDFEKADYYKSLIVSNYPDSDYAKVILDPDFYIKQAEEKNQASKLYEKTYDAYEKGQYYRVITYANKAVSELSPDSLLASKFLFLRAISLGKVEVPDTLYAALDQLIVNYPKSPVIPQAQAVLRMLQLQYGLGIPEEKRQEMLEEQKEESLFTFEPEKMHLFMIVVQSDKVAINPLKVRISDFKKKFFGLERLNIKSLQLDNTRSLITIGNFDDQAKAEDFMSTMVNDEYVLSGIQADEVELFTISINNYPIFYREKSVVAYRDFYNKYYLNFNN